MALLGREKDREGPWHKPSPFCVASTLPSRSAISCVLTALSVGVITAPTSLARVLARRSPRHLPWSPLQLGFDRALRLLPDSSSQCIINTARTVEIHKISDILLYKTEPQSSWVASLAVVSRMEFNVWSDKVAKSLRTHANGRGLTKTGSNRENVQQSQKFYHEN